MTACFHVSLHKVICYKSISDQTFPHVLWLRHSFSSSDGAAALISIRAIRFHQHTHESQEDGWIEAHKGEDQNIRVCSSLIQVRIRKRKVMEDAGIHPLLPIHKHDLWMILRWESWESLGGLRRPVCNAGQCWLCQHALQQGMCDRVFLWVWIKPKTWKSLDCVCSSCTRCVCSQGLSFSSSFLLLNHIRSEQLWGLAVSQVTTNWFQSQGCLISP